MSESKQYELRTIKDIFELPTAEMMETALNEIVPFMISTRAMLDVQEAAFKVLAEGAGQEIPDDFQFAVFPEVMLFKDDGKGESTAIFEYQDGQSLEMTLKHE